MRRIVFTAPLAGLLGSVAAVAILALMSHPGPTDTARVLSVGVAVALMVGAMVTVPACLILGTPLIYAFRSQLRNAPWRWSLLVTFLGMIIGAIVFGSTVASSTSPVGLGLVLLFSGTSSMSFALLYGLLAPGATGGFSQDVADRKSGESGAPERP